MEDRPFVKLLRTQNGTYVYDINTNHVFGIDQMLYDALSAENPTAKQLRMIRSARQTVTQLTGERSTFDSAHPTRVEFPWDAARRAVQQGMHYLRLEVTQRCNLRCDYCFFSGQFDMHREHSSESMPIGVARAAVDFLDQHSRRSTAVQISFYGGEPLLNFPIIERTVEFARQRIKDRRLFFDIVTNGTLLSPLVGRFLARNNFCVTVSLDGPEDVHDRRRHYPNGVGSHQDVVRGVAILAAEYGLNYKGKVVFRCTLPRPGGLSRVREFFNLPEMRENELVISTQKYPHRSYAPTSGADALQSLWDECSDLLQDYLITPQHSTHLRYVPRELLRVLSSIANRKKGALGSSVYPNRICLPGITWPTVTVDGKIVVCDNLAVAEDFGVGDVYKGVDQAQIERLVEAYVGLCQRDCTECWLVRLCPCCFVDTVDERGQMNPQWRVQRCERVRQIYEFVFERYLGLFERRADTLGRMRRRQYSGGKSAGGSYGWML